MTPLCRASPLAHLLLCRDSTLGNQALLPAWADTRAGGRRAPPRRSQRRAIMARPRMTIWEHAQLQGYSRRDFLQFCTWLGAAAGIEAAGDHPGRARAGHEAAPAGRLVPLPGVHLLQRVLHPLVASDRVRHHPGQDLARLHARRCRRRRGTRPRRPCTRRMEKYKGEYLMLVEGSVPTGGRRGLLLHRRPHGARHRHRGGAGRQGRRLLGQLRLQRLHPGRQAQPDRRDAHRGVRQRQAAHQGARVPADRGGDGRRPSCTCWRSTGFRSSTA